LAFVDAFRTATQGTASQGTASMREGVIVRVTTETGVVGLGEASPLVERREGTAAEVVALCESVGSGLVGDGGGGLPSLLTSLATRPGGRALACGLESALLDAAGREQGASASALLATGLLADGDGGAVGGRVADRVVVNATIGQADTEGAVRAAVDAVAAGFGTVKLKVGMEKEVEAEVRRVAAVREAIGDGVRLRIDANGAWEVDRAVETAKALVAALGPSGLEWIEQPVAAHEIAGLKRVREESGVAVAADESAISVGHVEQIVGMGAVDAVVLKPMSLGGLAKTREAALVARRAGVQAVVTTSIDSGVGTAAALHVAASLGDGVAACGLATAELLESDLLRESLRVVDGAMVVPQGGGLGVELANDGPLVWSVFS
jgi:o-succinylbenzoate synthase